MPINDKINRTFVRNRSLKNKDITNTQKHNERENEIYQNPDIVKEHSKYNIHFKSPNASYQQVFEEMEQSGAISTRGLKSDAVHFGELIFDVNSAYFHNNGGYEFAKQFYQDAYKAAAEIIGGEEYIVSAVMHADERNRAISEALGQDVFHYHLHVVYIPIVEKEILWSKRCKDKNLIGTVKEKINQVSNSKKWASKEVLDEKGKPVLSATGKKTFRKSYSVLQDDFYNFMKKTGYEDIERGERGSTEEHLTVTQFKVKQEQDRLESVTEQLTQTEQALLNTKSVTEKQEKKLAALQKETQTAKVLALSVQDIEAMGKPQKFTGNMVLTVSECDTLKKYAVKGIMASAENKRLKSIIYDINHNAEVWKKRFVELQEKVQPYLDALEFASEKVLSFLSAISDRKKDTIEQSQFSRRHQKDMEI